MIKLNTLMENIAEELSGSFTPYDESRSVLIVPVDENRFQRVVCAIKTQGADKILDLESKVCEYNESLHLKDLLVENGQLHDAKFLIRDNFLMVGASSVIENITKDHIRNMIGEVARVADKWEFELTGVDIH